MRTDDLIAVLAVDLPAARPGAIERRLLMFMIPAAAVVLAGVLWWLGLRADLGQAVGGVTFWAKAAYTAAAAGAGFWLLERLGRPGVSVRAPIILSALILLTVFGAAAVELTMAEPAARMRMVMGRSAQVCPTNIVALSALAAPFAFYAARRFAPVRPASAGAAAGLLAGGVAATLYGLHCPEHTAAFVAIWYTLGLVMAAGLGALIGKFVFRW